MSSKKAQKQRQREPRLRLKLGRVLGTVHPLWLKVEVAKSAWSRTLPHTGARGGA